MGTRDQIDVVVSSHPHSDHAGSLLWVLSTFKVGTYIDDGVTYASATKTKIDEHAAALGNHGNLKQRLPQLRATEDRCGVGGREEHWHEQGLPAPTVQESPAVFLVHGAGVGDLFMSPIRTCDLNGVNPFDYFTELQREAGKLKQGSSEWMPWSYHEALARLATLAAA